MAIAQIGLEEGVYGNNAIVCGGEVVSPASSELHSWAVNTGCCAARGLLSCAGGGVECGPITCCAHAVHMAGLSTHVGFHGLEASCLCTGSGVGGRGGREGLSTHPFLS